MAGLARKTDVLGFGGLGYYQLKTDVDITLGRRHLLGLHANTSRIRG